MVVVSYALYFIVLAFEFEYFLAKGLNTRNSDILCAGLGDDWGFDGGEFYELFKEVSGNVHSVY